MSTLGGSKGERHAKPTKFAALDINRLYSSSRVSISTTTKPGMKIMYETRPRIFFPEKVMG